MIGSILMCDQCGESIRVGAVPCGSGAETRKADKRGTIRRVRLGRMHRPGSARPGKVYAVDLCELHRSAERIAELQRQKSDQAARWLLEWRPA